MDEASPDTASLVVLGQHAPCTGAPCARTARHSAGVHACLWCGSSTNGRGHVASVTHKSTAHPAVSSRQPLRPPFTATCEATGAWLVSRQASAALAPLCGALPTRGSLPSCRSTASAPQTPCRTRPSPPARTHAHAQARGSGRQPGAPGMPSTRTSGMAALRHAPYAPACAWHAARAWEKAARLPSPARLVPGMGVRACVGVLVRA